MNAEALVVYSTLDLSVYTEGVTVRLFTGTKAGLEAFVLGGGGVNDSRLGLVKKLSPCRPNSIF